MSKMIDRLQPFMRKSAVFSDVFEAAESMAQSVKECITDTRLQFDVSTATWGIENEERDLGIELDVEKSIEERRSVVKAKLRGSGKVGSDLLKMVIDSWTNGDCTVEINGSIVLITFNSFFGRPSNIDDVKAAIEEVIPAHLGYEISFRYLSIVELQSMTISELESTPLNKFAPFI